MLRLCAVLQHTTLYEWIFLRALTTNILSPISLIDLDPIPVFWSRDDHVPSFSQPMMILTHKSMSLFRLSVSTSVRLYVCMSVRLDKPQWVCIIKLYTLIYRFSVSSRYSSRWTSRCRSLLLNLLNLLNQRSEDIEMINIATDWT